MVRQMLVALFTVWTAMLASAGAEETAGVPAVVVNVREYGATGNGESDDAPAFRKALLAAKPGSTVVIPAGTYRLMPIADDQAKGDRGLISCDNLQDVVITGEDSPLLVMGAHQNGLFLKKCRNVTVRQLRIDYNPLNFTQGVVTSYDANANSFTVSVAPGYAKPDCDIFKNSHAVFFDPLTRRMAHPLGEAYVEHVTAMPDGTFRLQARNQFSAQIPGNLFALTTRQRAESVRVDDSEQVLLEDLIVYSGPGVGFFSHRNAEITLRRCTIIPRPGTDRLYSTAADGFHCKLTRRPVVESCNFSGMGDDAINIASGPSRVCEQLSEDEIVVDPYFFQAKTGDSIDFMDLISGEILATRTLLSITNVAWRKEGKIKLKLDRAYTVPATAASLNLPAAREPGGMNWMRTMREAPISPTLVICPESCGRGAIIRNNIFHNFRGRGIMLHAPDARIEGNVFEHLAGPGIVIGDDFSWGEFGSGRGAIIRNNIFRGVRRSNIQAAEAGLPARAAAKEKTMKPAYAIRDLLIDGNRFEDYGATTWSYGRGVIGNVLSFCDTQNVRVSNNTFGPASAQAMAAPLLIIEDSRTIELRENAPTITDDKVQFLGGADRASLVNSLPSVQPDKHSGAPAPVPPVDR